MAIDDELTEVLRTAAERHHVPGAAAGLLVDGERHTAAVGVTSVDDPIEVNARTLFQVASITKTFTSAAIMLLVQEGLVALEDPVVRHLPDLGARTGLDAEAITVEHLLSHQAGFDGDHLFVGGHGSIDALKDARRLFAPGAGYSYNNAAFSLAGLVIESVSDLPFDRFVRTRLLAPLGLKEACFRADDAITRRVALPHVVLEDTPLLIRHAGWQPGWQLEPIDWAAGGLVASADHLLEWARFQLDGLAADGSQLLTPESLARVHTPVVTADCTEDIGLDWFVERHGPVTTFRHNGVTAGYCSILMVAPNDGIGIVSLTHATNGALVNDEVWRWALDRFTAAEIVDPVPDPALAIDTARLSGQFLSPFALLTVTAGDAPGTIHVEGAPRTDVDGWKPPPDPPLTFGFFAPDHAVSVDKPGLCPQVMRVHTGETPADDWLHWGGRRSPRVV